MARGFSFGLVGACVALGCAEEPVVVQSGPAVHGLDRQTVTVGEPLVVYGSRFLSPEEGRTELVFEGTFLPDDGSPAFNVSRHVVAPLYDGTLVEPGTVAGRQVDTGTTFLRWNRFGPFDVPFGPGNVSGTFKGTVTPVNASRDGRIEEGAPTPLSLEVGRSVIITALTPITGVVRDGSGAITSVETAPCAGPALRGLGGLGYVLEVEAVGFTPTAFRYQFTNVNGLESLPEIVHTVTDARRTDVVGDPTRRAGDPVIVLNPVPEDAGWAIAAIRVTAVDERGDPVYAALPLTVVRPLGYHYDGNRELAEYYEPVAVNGPFIGSTGNEIEYTETVSEDRQQGVSVSVSREWSQQTGVEESQDWSRGVSVGSSFSTTDEHGVEHSEAQSSSETFGEDYSTGGDTSVAVGTEDGTEWSWSAEKGTSAEQYAEAMKELSGEASVEVSGSVTGEGSLPGIAKASATVGTTVGATVGMSTGTTTGERVGTSESVGASMSGSSGSSTVYGSTTSESRSKSFSGSFALESQQAISSSTAVTEASEESRSFTVGGSGSVSEGFSSGQAESWDQSWVSSRSHATSVSLSAKLPNKRCAMIYRQTVRWVRQAQLYNYDLCGVRSLMGELSYNEWTWSPEIAIGPNCDSVRSSLPKAQCFLACE